MVRMIPSIYPLYEQNQAESKVFAAIQKGLSDDYTVFHSFNVIAQNARGTFIDGEIDFLIYSPKAGFLVLEVKGGVIEYDGGTGTWYQNNRPLKKCPFEQGETAKHKLKTYLSHRIDHLDSVPFGYAVCFPNVHAPVSVMKPGVEAWMYLTGPDLPNIKNRVEEILSKFAHANFNTIRGDISDHIKQVIMPHCEYGLTLQDRIGEYEEKLLALTENQLRMIDFICLHRQAMIQGCAGSGKTILAIKKARELATEGKTVLLLSYNRMVNDKMAKSLEGVAGIRVSTYHDFCMDYIGQEQEILNYPRDREEFWNKTVPEYFDKFLKKNPVKYDAVIVDEGQDFAVEWWYNIVEMTQDDGHFYIFYDPSQNIFKRELEFPIKSIPFVLKDNCRNTKRICEELVKHTSDEMKIDQNAPEGEDIIEFKSAQPDMRRRQLGKILHKLINRDNIAEARVVILGGHSMHKTCIGQNNQVGAFKICENQDAVKNGISYYTYMKFKGCEADVVILLDVDTNDARWANDAALYTAKSRAKHLLYIIGTK